eukprot:1155976-Pelagomonas_calceolata.AAC.2
MQHDEDAGDCKKRTLFHSLKASMILVKPARQFFSSCTHKLLVGAKERATSGIQFSIPLVQQP